MSLSPSTGDSVSPFVCECEEESRPACTGEPFYQYHELKRYCVLHHPESGKSADFKRALQRKLDNKDFNFRGVWFPDEAPFEKFQFSAEADFTGATFNALANFYKAKFSAEAYFNATFAAAADFSFAGFGAQADFIGAVFTEKANFSYARFSAGADFDATFKGEANFNYATFTGEAYFRYAVFSKKINLRSATFKDHLRFGQTEFGEEVSLDLQYARIEKPDHVSFDSLTLRPHWFVNVDPRKFDFINIKWNWPTIEQEIESLSGQTLSMEAKEKLSLYHLLGRAYRQLAVNAEENNRYDEASKFRYQSMELWSLDKDRAYITAIAGRLYRLASGYGEQIGQALLILSGIWISFAIAYVLTRHIPLDKWYDIFNALAYSLGVITLQRPEPKPSGILTPALVTLEMILGPVQVALLALAIRRQFMR